MKHYLRTNIGTTGFEEISENYFRDIKRSYDCLLNIFEIERKYDLIVSNYIELENEFNSVLVNHFVGRYPGWINHLEVQLQINRRLANFLSTCKTYMDQKSRHVSCCFDGAKDQSDRLEKFASSIYDANPHYRLMEALRNHVQHYSLPVHESKIGGERIEEIRIEFEYKAAFYLKKKEILQNKGFKASVRDEMPEKVELISSVRSYMRDVSKVHTEARKIVATRINQSHQVLIDILGSDQKGGLELPVEALRQGDDGEMKERIPVMLTHYHEINKFHQKNMELHKIDRGYFSTSPFD